MRSLLRFHGIEWLDSKLTHCHNSLHNIGYRKLRLAWQGLTRKAARKRALAAEPASPALEVGTAPT